MYTKDEKKALVHLFWTSFDWYCSQQGYLSDRKKKWMLHRTKINNIRLKFDLKKDSVQVAIELFHRDEEERIRIFEKIAACKTIVEEGFPQGLTWEFLYTNETGHEVCRIFASLEGYRHHEQSNWPVIFEFMAKNMFLLERNFLEIRDIINEEWD